MSDPISLPRPTELAQMLVRTALRPGDTAIDATAGHGHDTLFLADCVGPGGRVLAFDIQERAIRSATAKLLAAGCAGRVEFHQANHARLTDFAPPESISAVMFNLGYLPGADHHLTTQTNDTLTALSAAGGLLRPGGLLSVVAYPGHPAGAPEALAVETWLTAQTARGWQVAKYAMLGTLKPAPVWFVARKA